MPPRRRPRPRRRRWTWCSPARGARTSHRPGPNSKRAARRSRWRKNGWPTPSCPRRPRGSCATGCWNPAIWPRRSRRCLTLAMIDPVWVRAWLPEPDLGKIAPGMKAEIRSDSYPEKVYSGWVGYLSPTAEFTPKNVGIPGTAHAPGLPVARLFLQSRRRTAPGHAGHGHHRARPAGLRGAAGRQPLREPLTWAHPAPTAPALSLAGVTRSFRVGGRTITALDQLDLRSPPAASPG